MFGNGRNVIKFGVPPDVSWDEIEMMFHYQLYNQIRLVSSQHLFIDEREMEAHLEELTELANIVSACRVARSNVDTFKNVEDAAAFFHEHCFYRSIGELRKRKDEMSSCYEGSSESILGYLSKLPLKKDVNPELEEVDFIHLCGGQAITIAENMFTLSKMLEYTGNRLPVIYASKHVYHSYPESVDQYKVAMELLHQNMKARGLYESLPKCYTTDLMRAAFGRSIDGNLVPFRRPADEMKKLLTRVSMDCQDAPLTGIVISTQPEQIKRAVDEVFGSTAHTVHMAYVHHPDAMTIKAEYWGESSQVTAMFGLLDLAKVLVAQSK